MRQEFLIYIGDVIIKQVSKLILITEGNDN